MAIERVFVAGAGLMGHGIAQVHAAVGKDVVLYEPDLSRAEAGRDRIAGNLDRAVAKGRLDAAARDAILARIHPTADLGKAGDRQLIVEAVFEDPAVKETSVVRAGPRRADGHASSPPTRHRSRSIAWPPRSITRAVRASSGCTSSARCR